MADKIRSVGELKKIISELPDDMMIECEVHKLDNTYIIEKAYTCGNMIGELILCFSIKSDWELTERDRIAFKKWCEEND